MINNAVGRYDDSQNHIGYIREITVSSDVSDRQKQNPHQKVRDDDDPLSGQFIDIRTDKQWQQYVGHRNNTGKQR